MGRSDLTESYLSSSPWNDGRHPCFPHDGLNGRLLVAFNGSRQARPDAESDFGRLLSAHPIECYLVDSLVHGPLPVVGSLLAIIVLLNKLAGPYSYSFYPRNVKFLEALVMENWHRLIFDEFSPWPKSRVLKLYWHKNPLGKLYLIFLAIIGHFVDYFKVS